MGRLNQMSFVFENIFECSYLKALVGKGVGASGDFAVYEKLEVTVWIKILHLLQGS